MGPFRQANTNLFRFGPTCFRTNEEKYVFLQITKSHETYNQLPDEVFRVKRKKRKKLVEACADDNSVITRKRRFNVQDVMAKKTPAEQ